MPDWGFPNFDGYLDPDGGARVRRGARHAGPDPVPVSAPCNVEGCAGMLRGTNTTPQWARSVTALCDVCGRQGYIVTRRS